MSKFYSKKSGKHVETTKPSIQDAVASLKEEAKQVVKRRRSREFQVFRYRNQPFILINRENQTTICTYDQKTGTPEPRLVVDREKAKQAVRLLVKVMVAEDELEQLHAKPPSHTSI